MSAVILSDSKSVLAKLLAGENLNVVHQRISTAMIDLKTRTLYCPIWEDMSGELYDLLMGHEVSHALHTPTEGWHDNIVIGKDAKGNDIIDKKFKGVLNVVEDARIEKMIKRKYPGLCKSFIAGYKTLFERDFFGIKRLKNDYSSLNIIDRVNLYAKCGAFLVVPFADHEKDIVREVENAETWEQVVDIAKRLQDMARQEQESKMNDLDDLTEELLKQFEDKIEDLDLSDDESEASEDNTFTPDEDANEENPDRDQTTSKDEEGEESEEEETDGEGDKTTESDEDSEEEDEAAGTGDDDGEESDEDDDKDTLGGASEGGTEGSENDPESVTDKAFRERERELISDALEIFQYNLPKPLLDRIIVPNKVFLDNFYDHIAKAKKSYANDPIVETCSLRFNQNNNRYINLLVKEFEMRKNAGQYARTTQARTGELDMSKLHKYKFSNDLFRKVSVVEKGKSHGMIMYVDMSGSMDGVFGPTMEQTLILVAFCRKVGIPFDVYGFSDNKAYLASMISKGKLSREFLASSEKFQRTGFDKYSITEQGFHLIHFISSQFGGNHYRRAYDAMATVAMNWKNRLYSKTYLNWDEMGFDLGGTPFTQAIMASRPMIDKFKADNRVDITNVIYLTDGDGTGCFKFTDIKPAPYVAGKQRIQQRIYMIDPKTKQRVEFEHNGSNDPIQHQTAMTQFVRKVTGCKHIGFYIAEGSTLKYKVAALSKPEKAVENDKSFRENGYFSAPHIGYDMYYYVTAQKSNVKDKDYSISESDTTNKIAKVFTDAQESKRRHRVLVSTFAKDIAA